MGKQIGHARPPKHMRELTILDASDYWRHEDGTTTYYYVEDKTYKGRHFRQRGLQQFLWFVFALACLAAVLVFVAYYLRDLPQPPEAVMAIPDEPAPTPKYSTEDAELLARLLWSECRGENRTGQLAVAQCVLDRLEDGRWGETIAEVISSKRQFAKPGRLTEELLSVAVAALTGERAMPEHRILYFRSKVAGPQNWHAPYLAHIGGHAFYGFNLF